MKTWIKAGLLGGIAGVVLTLPTVLSMYFPLVLGSIITTCTTIIFFVLYPGVGALAAFWMPTPRTTKQAAIDGALAGTLAFAIDGAATVVMALLALWTGGFAHYMQQVLPYATPEMVARTYSLTIPVTLGCSCLNVLLGAGLNALGGLVFAAVKPE